MIVNVSAVSDNTANWTSLEKTRHRLGKKKSQPDDHSKNSVNWILMTTKLAKYKSSIHEKALN